MGLPEGWLLQRRGRRGRRPGRVAMRGQGGREGKGNDASQAGSYQSERGKAKSTAIDATGHAEYNKDALRFPVSPFTSFSR